MGVVSGMTNAIGLGTGFHSAAYISWQNAEHSRHDALYQHQHLPEEYSSNLPESLVQYNQWLEDTLAYLGGHTEVKVTTLMGFMMGFRRDFPMHDAATNRFIWGGKNAHQEYYLFQTRKDVSAYVCHDVFIYHDKTSVSNPIIREAMLRNMQLTNKPGTLGKQA